MANLALNFSAKSVSLSTKAGQTFIATGMFTWTKDTNANQYLRNHLIKSLNACSEQI